MLNNFKRILILAPHVDDGELGCGGTMAKFIGEKKQVFYVAFSSAEKSIREGLPKDTHRKEMREAMKVFKIPDKNISLFEFEARNYLHFRQEILEGMVKIRKRIKPDLVFLPSTFDTHQDHQVISQEGFRAFKEMSILGYELPWNNLTFTTRGFVILKPEHLSKKTEALSRYKSQTRKFYMAKDFIRSLARARGVQVGVQYAEAFEIIKWIIK